MAYTPPTLQQITNRLQTNWQARREATDGLAVAAGNAILETVAGALHSVYAGLSYQYDQATPITADIDSLRNWAAQFGLTQNEGETTEAFRSRLISTLKTSARIGRLDDYAFWATLNTHVTRAWALANGTAVDVYVLGAENAAVNATQRTSVAATIEANRPEGVSAINIISPTLSPTAISVRVAPNTAENRATATTALEDHFDTLDVGEDVNLSAALVALVSAGLTDVAITSPSADVSISPPNLATLGAITWV